MKHLPRTHRVSVAEFRERFQDPDISFHYVESARQRAAICTKAFTNQELLLKVCDLMNVIDPKRLKS